MPLPLSQYHLLELPTDLVPLFDPSADSEKSSPAIKKRKLTRLTIKGRFDDQAVLTTDDQTFALRSVSQSNSLLLCSFNTNLSLESKPLLYLRSNVTDTLELTPVVPRLQRLMGLLAASSYDGEDEEKGPQKQAVRKYTLKQVKSIVQASPKELEAGLLHHHVIELDGFVRQLSSQHLTTILQALISHLDLYAFLSERVPLKETVQALGNMHGLRKQVIEPVLTRFFGRSNDDADSSDEQTVAVDTVAIVKFLGVQKLRSMARLPISLEAFTQSWIKDCLSDAFQSLASLSLLEGEFILHPAPLPTATLFPVTNTAVQIQYYSVQELPTEPAARFQDLFLTRPSWIAHDLLPFIKDLALNTKQQDSLLLKFARTTKTKVLDWTLTDDEKRKWNKDKKLLEGKSAWKDVTMYSARVKY